MTVAMAAAVGIVAVVAVAVAALASMYVAKTQAQAAADAAALAAAVATYPSASTSSPLASARHIAERNGAALLSCRCSRSGALSARTVEVVTAVLAEVPIFGEVTVQARSRAEFDPMRWLGR
jgi:hypothetical protein